MVSLGYTAMVQWPGRGRVFNLLTSRRARLISSLAKARDANTVRRNTALMSISNQTKLQRFLRPNAHAYAIWTRMKKIHCLRIIRTKHKEWLEVQLYIVCVCRSVSQKLSPSFFSSLSFTVSIPVLIPVSVSVSTSSYISASFLWACSVSLAPLSPIPLWRSLSFSTSDYISFPGISSSISHFWWLFSPSPLLLSIPPSIFSLPLSMITSLPLPVIFMILVSSVWTLLLLPYIYITSCFTFIPSTWATTTFSLLVFVSASLSWRPASLLRFSAERWLHTALYHTVYTIEDSS